VVISTPATASAIFDLTYTVASNAGTQVNVGAASDVDIQFTVANANQPVAWFASGIPPGLSFVGGAVGALTGAPVVMGSFVTTVQATDAIGLKDSVDVALTVGPPDVGLQIMAEPFLGVGPVNTALETFLDLQGNADGTYDLGDFRTWVLGNPNHPLNAPAGMPPTAGAPTGATAGAPGGAAPNPIVIPLFGETHR